MFKYTNAYTIKNLEEGRMSRIVLTQKSDYPEVEYQYGAVQLLEEDDTLRVKFEYEIFDNPKKFKTDDYLFRSYVGKILFEILEEELTYATREK